MAVEVSERTVKEFRTARLKENAAPKTINEEVGFLLRLLGEQGDSIRAKLRRQKALKLRVKTDLGKAYDAEERGLLFTEAKKRRSKAIYPALVLSLNCGVRDNELRSLRWSPQPDSWGSRSTGGPLACNQQMRVRFPPLPPNLPGRPLRSRRRSEKPDKHVQLVPLAPSVTVAEWLGGRLWICLRGFNSLRSPQLCGRRSTDRTLRS